MVRAIGIDPGTKSFDVCGIEDGKVFYEEVLHTNELASSPEIIIDVIEDTMPVDLITGPSGYGVETTYLKDLDYNTLEDWYLTYILLLKREDLKAALARDEPGIMVYFAMVQMALEMKNKGWPVCYIPGVINLTTVPGWRKLNKLDMGTVDKLCCGVLGIQDQAKEMHISYTDTSFILVEMGYGYNSVLAVKEGKIVDGLGGTTNGMGFLSAGSVDFELVQLVGGWEKLDIFSGGAASILKTDSIEALIEDELARNGLMEGIEKGVASMLTSTEPKEILLSGRLTRIPDIKEDLHTRLEKFAPVRKLRSLPGAMEVKEAAQGYAMVAEGLAGGEFSDLIDSVKIKDAKGTALDYLYHPKGKSIAKGLKGQTPFSP